MFHAALWAAGLLGCLSLVAFAAALGGRSGKRWKIVFLAIAAATAPFLLSAGAVAGAATLRAIGSEPSWLAYAVGWGAAFTIGAAVLVLLAIRPRANGSLASASWRRLPLLGGCVVGAIGFFISLDRMDASVRADMDAQQRAMRDTLVSFVPPPVPESENAAPHYLPAFALLDDLGITADFEVEVFDLGFDPGSVEARETLKNGTAALKSIREALAFPLMRKDNIDPDEAFFLAEGHALHFRDAAVLLALDARTRASSGELKAAFSSGAAMWRLAAHALEANQNFIQFSMACAVAKQGSRTLENVLAILGEREPPPTAEAPPSDLVFHARAARAFENERARLVGSLLQTLAEAMGRVQGDLPGIDRLVDPGSLGRLFARQYFALYRCFVLPSDLALLDSRMATVIALAGRPYPEARRGLLELKDEVERRPGGLFSGMLVHTHGVFLSTGAEADAHMVLARTGLAAATFRARRGAYPARIDDLVPDFLPAIPLDPFDGSPLKLAASEGGLVLYSVGKDGIDDGGAEPERPTGRKGDIAFRLGAAYAAHRERLEADRSPDEDFTEE